MKPAEQNNIQMYNSQPKNREKPDEQIETRRMDQNQMNIANSDDQNRFR